MAACGCGVNASSGECLKCWTHRACPCGVPVAEQHPFFHRTRNHSCRFHNLAECKVCLLAIRGAVSMLENVANERSSRDN